MSPQALWEKVNALYALPGAREALLSLQDRCGADVPMLLWAATLALKNQALDAATAQAARVKGEAIAQGVRAVRALRRKLPEMAPATDTDAARAALLSSELALERLQLDGLAGMAGHKASAASVLHNLNVAAAACGCFATPESIEALAQILSQ